MIRSTFSGITTALLGMSASQRAMEVTGQNIANVNTEGYTKQRLDIASLNTKHADFYNYDTRISIGFGVEMTGVSQLRDPFLDVQYRTQIGKLGTTDAQAGGLEELEAILDETTLEGIRNALNNITSSLDTLSQHVGEKEYDTIVRSNMQNLLNLFHENATRLQDVRDDVQHSFQTSDVADLNQILQNIANLNTSIKNSQVLGNPALELKDQRNSLLDELASYLPIEVDYRDESIGPGQTVEVLRVYFTDTEGNKYTLISDGRYGSFDTDITGEPVNLYLNDANGNSSADVTWTLGNGTLKGTLDFLNKSGDFDNTDFRGLGYYEKALDSLVATFAEAFNDMNRPVGANGDRVDPTDPNANPLFEKIDENAEWSASNIKIADGWSDGTYGITASVNTDGSGNVSSTANDNILNMMNLLEKDIDFEYTTPDGLTTRFFTGTFYSCYSNIESVLGVDLLAAQTTLTNQISVLNQTSNSRDSVSGVSLDEEGMNLLQYNHSYAASARFMTTLDELLDRLINSTGVVGR